jgi:hypothetical protein
VPQPQAKRVKAAAPKPTAKAGCAARELRLGKPSQPKYRKQPHAK